MPNEFPNTSITTVSGPSNDDHKTHSKLTVCIMNNLIVLEQFQSVNGHQFDFCDSRVNPCLNFNQK